MREVRGAEVGMIFQDPMTSLNPSMTVGQQVAEALSQHHLATKREARRLAVEALARVRIPNAERVARQYPHTLSGGLRQRVMIAMAIAPRPVLLIADEPTTALDVTVQAEILDLLRELRAEYALTVLLITHDLGVVSEFCDEVAVMYAGRIVERAPAERLFSSPKHPYTLGLLASLPGLSPQQEGRQRLNAIPGQPPDPASIPSGCPFHPRCPRAMPACSAQEPPEVELDAKQQVSCLLYS
jgi:oligopeptide/dipeptide ABC transporter ATP-binding protein